MHVRAFFSPEILQAGGNEGVNVSKAGLRFAVNTAGKRHGFC